MARYVEVPADQLVDFLTAKGFSKLPTTTRPAGQCFQELVMYRRHHHDPTLMVKVYTSVVPGDPSARGRGQDAIRVVAVDGGPEGKAIYKGTRVFRAGTVEGVLERLYERMREAYQRCNDVHNQRWRAARKRDEAAAWAHFDKAPQTGLRHNRG